MISVILGFVIFLIVNLFMRTPTPAIYIAAFILSASACFILTMKTASWRKKVFRFLPILCVAIILSCPSINAAYAGGKVTFFGGAPATDIDILAMTFTSPLPFMTITDSLGDYSITIDILPGIHDSLFVFCSSGVGYHSAPEYYIEYISDTDSLTGMDFVLWPDSVPGFSLTVWVVDSIGDAINDVEALCRFDGTGVPDVLDSTDYGGRCVLSLDHEGDYIVTATYTDCFSVPAVETVYVGIASPNPEIHFTMLDSALLSPYWIYIEGIDIIGEPVESLFVEWSPADSSDWTPRWTDSTGFAAFNPPRPGEYDIRMAYFMSGFFIDPVETTMVLTATESVDTLICRILPDTNAIAESVLPKSSEISVYPNPFNSAVTIFLDTPVGAGLRPARVEIFDLAGRRVAQLPSPSVPLPAGEGGNSFSFWEKVSEGRMRAEFTWQPEESVGSGVYLVLATADGETVMRRIVYLK